MTILFAKPGTFMRCKAPEGDKFGKMLFYNYRTPNFLVGDDYEEKVLTDRGSLETMKFWVPSSPHQNQYGSQMWDGDASNVLFNCPTFNAYFMKIDMRLVPDGSAGIREIESKGACGNVAVGLDGRTYGLQGLRKGIYIIDGKKRVIR